ncbi:MAG: hypothetical protein ACRDT4_21375 [Micromonosporaceae bacterium]
MSQYAVPGAPTSGSPYPATGEYQATGPMPMYSPQQPRLKPAWMTSRSVLEWVAVGVGGFGLLIAVISLALPWEYHGSDGEYGYTLYTSAQGSGGLSYTGGLTLLVGTLIAMQFVPHRFKLPLRVFAAVMSLMLVGLLAGVIVTAILEDDSRSSVDEISWGLILAFLAVIVLGVSAALAQPSPQAAAAGPVGGVDPVSGVGPVPEGGMMQPGEPHPYQGQVPGGHA